MGQNVDDIQGLGLQGECFYFRGGVKIGKGKDELPARIRGDIARRVMEELVTEENGFTASAHLLAMEEQ